MADQEFLASFAVEIDESGASRLQAVLEESRKLAGDLSSHTTTADGYVVVNRLKTTNGTIQIEVPQNSLGDDFLRRWAKWARSTNSPNRIALGTLTITDNVSGFQTVCTGVSLQKAPDRTYDRTATNVTYTLLAATISEQ